MACGERCVTDPDMQGVLGLSSVGQSHPGQSVSEASVVLCEQVALTLGDRRMRMTTARSQHVLPTCDVSKAQMPPPTMAGQTHANVRAALC